MKIKVVAISDQHGFLPDIPECDLLLIAGDICPTANHSVGFQENWLNTNFRTWLKNIKAKKIVGVAGNHDFIFQQSPHRVPKDLPWTYLEDSGTEFEGLKIWGSPWQPVFYDWAFNLVEPELIKKWELIPNDTNILVLHGPPHGFGDKAPRYNFGQGGCFERKIDGYENTGSPGLLTKIKEIKPKLAVAGHIHCSAGVYHLDDDTIICNASLVNERYELVNKPNIFEVEIKEK